MHLEKGKCNCKTETVLHTCSIGEAYVERGRIRVDGDERWTVIVHRILRQGLALDRVASRGDDPDV